MAPTETTRQYVIKSYVQPARSRGQKTVQVRVGNVLKELGWTNRTPSVFSTLGSLSFQRQAGLKLIEKRGGPASGGPSTTVEFVYQILDENKQPAPVSQAPEGLLTLYGICSATFKALGGGEEFLRRERAWGPDAWEKYDAEVSGSTRAEAEK